MEAPPAVNVALLPLQIKVGEEVAVTVGLGLTVKEIVFVLEHVPVLPITVYTVVAVAVTYNEKD